MMKNWKFLKASAAVLALAAACVLGGCSGSGTAETTAAGTETSAATETAAGGTEAETTAAELTGDAKLIAELDPVMPDLGKVTLGDLSKIEITAPIAQQIADEDVKTYIEDYVLYGQTQEVEDAAQDGDTVDIDFVGKLNGEAFDGGTAEGYQLVLGSNSFIDGFESGLIGARAGEKRSLNLTFPEDYASEDLAGKDVVFEVTVNSVSRPLTAEDLTDELANQFSAGNYPTAQAYRDGVREALELSASAIAKGELYSNAIKAAEGLSETAITDAAVDWQIDLYLQNYDKSLKSSYGFGLADLLSMYGQDYTEFRAGLEEGAEETAKTAAVVDAIARENGLEFNEENLKAYLDEYGYEENLVRDGSTEAWLEQTVIQYLVAKHLLENADVTYLPYEEYEAEALAAAEEETAAEAAAEDAASEETTD